jgi:tetratricopeptide (TPR) repeat protein
VDCRCESRHHTVTRVLRERHVAGPISLTFRLPALHSQVLGLLAMTASERGDLEAALDFATRAVERAKDLCARSRDLVYHLTHVLLLEANILESLGRFDEALARDAEYLDFNPVYGRWDTGPLVRLAIKHMAAGEDDKAECYLRGCLDESTENGQHFIPKKVIEIILRPHTVLAELLERRGTEEALAEARTLRDKVTQELTRHEARRAATLQEIRAAAAEAVRQWREERIQSRGEEKKGAKDKGKKKGAHKGKHKGKGKQKGRKAKAKGKGASPAAATEGGPPHEPAGEQAEGAAAGEAAAGAESQQQAPEGGSQPPGEEEDHKEEEEAAAEEECAICLQDLELEEDDEGGEGEALVVLRCGHRFHAICGDMWCAKCADKGWGVTCPGCRAAYVLAEN